MPQENYNGNSSDLELDHELPPGGSEGPEESRAVTEAGALESAAKTTDPRTAELEAELERARADRAAYLDRAARVQAEFENYRKRAVREQQEFREYAVADAVKSLLPILDSLDRAAKSNVTAVEDLRNGIELIDKQLHDALAKMGVQPVPAAGEPFDPNVHQAIQMVESEEIPDNHVVEELQRGYKLKDRLLRPAMVRVARNSKQ